MTDQIILSLSQLEITKGTEHQLQVIVLLLCINIFSCLLTGLRLLTKKVNFIFLIMLNLMKEIDLNFLMNLTMSITPVSTVQTFGPVYVGVFCFHRFFKIALVSVKQ